MRVAVDIIEEINRQFEEAIIVTDVGQHQMFTTQYIETDTSQKQLADCPVDSEPWDTVFPVSDRRTDR